MIRRIRWVGLILVLAIGAAGCQWLRHTPKRVQEILKEFQDYELSEIRLDYQVDCKIQIKSPKSNESGSCSILLTRDLKLLFTVHHPLSGTLFINYMDDERIVVVDRESRSYYNWQNSLKNRSKIPELSQFELFELQQILWGRADRSHPTPNLKITMKEGWPSLYQKETDAGLVSVSIKQRRLESDGTTFPRTLTIKDSARGTTIKIVITEFIPGLDTPLSIPTVPSDYKVVVDSNE